MGGGEKTTTTQANSEPWKPAQPYLKGNMQLANDMANAGIGGQVYQGPTVTPYAQQTQTGMNSIMDQAGANSNGQGLSGQSQDIINNGGFNAPQQQSMEYLSGVGTNPYDLSGNATYQAYKNDQLDDLQNRVSMGAASSGRYGSGAHTGALTDNLSQAGTAMDMQQFARNDQLNSQRFNAGQQGMGNLTSAYQMGQMPAQDMMKIGGMYEDLQTRVNQANINQFNDAQNKPWEQLARTNAIYSGAGSLGGTSSQTATAPGQNPFATGLGYASTGIGIAGGLKDLGFF